MFCAQAMPTLRSSQKSKVPLPSTPQRVQTDVAASRRRALGGGGANVKQEPARFVPNVQHV